MGMSFCLCDYPYFGRADLGLITTALEWQSKHKENMALSALWGVLSVWFGWTKFSVSLVWVGQSLGALVRWDNIQK